MCGIAGIIAGTGKGVHYAELKRMGDSIRHRGPDDEGFFVRGRVGLVNRRLAIIDLSPSGHQPMQSEGGKFTITYNGELYNYLALRPELEELGHQFHSKSDTEVILHAFEEWGPKCLDRFNGMFAFAIWDKTKKRLFIARDRLGIKPLYYVVHHGRFLFGSEIKALLAAGLEASVCAPALVEYFTFQNTFSDLTLFEGVRILPAGHHLTVDSSLKPKIERYWDLVLTEDWKGSEDEAADHVQRCIEESVTRQLMSDVPLGCNLSGGMDSSSIVAFASLHLPRLRTFTAGFDTTGAQGLEAAFDERRYAEHVAREFHTEHYQMVLHSGDMAAALPKLVYHQEDLRLGMSYPTWYIAKLTSKFVKVSMAGSGGDELFAGYPWRYEKVVGAKNERAHADALYEYWQRLVPEREHAAFFTKSVLGRARGAPPRRAFDRVLRAGRVRARSLKDRLLLRTLYFECKTFLHGLLVLDDHLTMAHSLEQRVPLLDDELVALASRLPARLKLKQGVEQGGKWVFRMAMRGILPDEIIERKKQGFSPPDETWYRGPSIEYVKKILLDPRSLARGYFQPAYVRRVIREHTSGKKNNRLMIWSLLCFEWWCRIFLDKERVEDGH